MNSTKYLLTYRHALIIHDLTIKFCNQHISRFSRTRDQMAQAARSGKQNIIEAVGQSQTSKRGEIKLLGVAKASFEELLADYEDYLRQNNLQIYSKTDSQTTAFRQKAYQLSHFSNLSNLGDLITPPQLPDTSTEAANFLLTLCHQETFLLHRQIGAMIDKFTRKGGVTEQLLYQRLNQRNK